ncbi:uncharacterized protein [Aegilops tauschii subsp. strangulata]|uniref:uncharacterized protein isoform X4 n=1 Tax=Aegilops tauschii subsp. strangulata TaxID=200361 RepID=UPI003CC84CB0
MKVSLVRGNGALLGGTLPLLPWVLASKHHHVWLAFHGYIEGPNLQKHGINLAESNHLMAWHEEMCADLRKKRNNPAEEFGE